MTWTKAGRADRKGALEEGAGAVQIALVAHDGGEVAEARRGVGVVSAQRRLADGEGLLVEGMGAVEVAQVAQENCKMVEAPGGGVVVRPEAAL
jgi:hypothetical protein